MDKFIILIQINRYIIVKVIESFLLYAIIYNIICKCFSLYYITKINV